MHGASGQRDSAEQPFANNNGHCETSDVFRLLLEKQLVSAITPVRHYSEEIHLQETIVERKGWGLPYPWASAVYNSEGEIVAAANGRPPAWAEGIHGAELWGLLMAASNTNVSESFRGVLMVGNSEKLKKEAAA